MDTCLCASPDCCHECRRQLSIIEIIPSGINTLSDSTAANSWDKSLSDNTHPATTVQKITIILPSHNAMNEVITYANHAKDEFCKFSSSQYGVSMHYQLCFI